jgi:hypothetical protein
MTVAEQLAEAIAAYRETLGHPVPTEVVQMFTLRPGPLLLEIRQAIALGRPVAGWAADYRRKQHAGHTLHEGHDPGAPLRGHRVASSATQAETQLAAAGTGGPRW